jgi:hypothetical protein
MHYWWPCAGGDERDRSPRLRPLQPAAAACNLALLFEAQLARSVRGRTLSEVPNMPSSSDQGGRPVTPCPKCKCADVKAVALASNFLYLRCKVCAFLYVIEDRRRNVRPEHQGRMFH